MKFFARRHKAAPTSHTTAPPTERELYEIISRAQAHIIQNGWTVGWGSVGGPTCIMGAIAVAMGMGTREMPSVRRTEIGQAAAQKLGFINPYEATRWNDSCGSERAVLRLFDKALAKLAPPPVEVPLLDGEIRVTDQRVRELV